MHVLSCIEHSVDGALSLPTACDEVRKSYYSSGISEYRPLAHDVIVSRIRTGTPTCRLFCVRGDSSFYGGLGKRSHAPTMPLVCVELNEM